MAQRIVVSRTSDLSDAENAHEITFTVDGQDFAIDLTDEEANEFLKVTQVYRDKGRRVGGRKHSTKGGRATTSPKGDNDNAQIRAWALENKLKVSDRGRISAELREKYAARNTAQKPSAVRELAEKAGVVKASTKAPRKTASTKEAAAS